MADVYESVLALSKSGKVPPDFVRLAQDQPGPNNAFRGDSAPPVIDMSRPRPECGALMADATRERGLFQVVNHGVPAAAVSEELQPVGRAFFSLPRQEKQEVHCTGSFGSIEGYGVGITTRRNLEGKKN